MKYSISLTLGLALCAAPSVAQVSGSINRDAPKVSNSITFANHAELSLSYTAIRFGEGRWQSVVDATDQHERFNSMAASRPIGSVSTTTTVVASGRKVPAGSYDMFFTVSEQAGWVFNLKSKDDADAEPIRWRLVLSDADKECKRIKFDLEAGDRSTEAVLTIAFGKKSVTVPLTLEQADKGEKKSG